MGLALALERANMWSSGSRSGALVGELVGLFIVLIGLFIEGGSLVLEVELQFWF
jgi:hypothetical protein